MMLADADIKLLRHMLGMHSNKPGYRNFYAPEKVDMEQITKLESLGLVRKGKRFNQLHYYHATKVGCKAAGLNAMQANDDGV